VVVSLAQQLKPLGRASLAVLQAPTAKRALSVAQIIAMATAPAQLQSEESSYLK
jgi:hypothetical protein